MKLGPLKAAIRAAANPRVYVQVGGIIRIAPVMQKGSLLEELDAAFPQGKAQETGLWVSEEGFLMREGDRPQTQATAE